MMFSLIIVGKMFKAPMLNFCYKIHLFLQKRPCLSLHFCPLSLFSKMYFTSTNIHLIYILKPILSIILINQWLRWPMLCFNKHDFCIILHYWKSCVFCSANLECHSDKRNNSHRKNLWNQSRKNGNVISNNYTIQQHVTWISSTDHCVKWVDLSTVLKSNSTKLNRVLPLLR